MRPVMYTKGRWAKRWWAGMVAATTTAICSTAARPILESALETSAAAEGHAMKSFYWFFYIQGGRIDLRWILGIIFDGGLLVFCFLGIFGGLLFRLGGRLLIRISTLAERMVWRTIGSEEGVVFDVSHKIPEWVGWRIEVVDGRHDVGYSLTSVCLR